MKLNFYPKIILLLSYLVSNYIYAQVPSIEWQKTFGGSNVEGSSKIIQTTDGGYILGGLSFSNDLDVVGNHGGSDFWVIKTSINGTLEWKKSFGGTGNEYLYSLQQTTNGGYILAGYTTSNNGDVTINHGGSDFWIVKISSLGIIEWEKSYGGSSDDLARSIQQTTDGGYIVVGITGSNNGDVVGHLGYNDFWVIKISSVGILEWQKTLGGSFYDDAYFIRQTTDGGYIVIGNTGSVDGNVTTSYGSDDILIVKLSSLGLLEWNKSIGGSGVDLSTCIIQTTDGGYIIAGQTNSTNIPGVLNYGNYDCLVIKLSSTGVIEWNKNYGGSNSDLFDTVQQTIDGGYILVGVTYSNNNDVTGYYGDRDSWVVKINSTGIIQWQKVIGGTGFDSGTDVIQTTDSGYIVFNSTSSSDGDFTLNNGNLDYGIVKFGPDNLSTNSFKEVNSISIFPNPTKDNLTIKLDYFTANQEITITDILGKIINNQKLDGLTTTINTSNLEKGIYILNLKNEAQLISQKFIKE